MNNNPRVPVLNPDGSPAMPTKASRAILLDEDEKPLDWIRIYPITYRYLENDQQYPRWSIISAEIERNQKDFRKESFRIEQDSIRVLRKIDTKNNWRERKDYLLPFIFDSVNDIKQQNKSLGLIKPKEIEKYYFRKTDRNWKPKQEQVLNQLDLFSETVDLEKIPYKFIYQFIDGDGKKRKYSISDWEIMQLYRNCRNHSKLHDLAAEQEALEKVRQKLEDNFMQTKDLYFIVGNLKNHPQNFMIIGLFYPPMIEYKQTSLFDSFDFK